jgi:hypothetical protein
MKSAKASKMDKTETPKEEAKMHPTSFLKKAVKLAEKKSAKSSKKK